MVSENVQATRPRRGKRVNPFPSVHPVRDYRIKSKLSLDELGSRAGASAATISRIESGDLWPTFDVLDGVLTACQGEVTANQCFRWSQQKRRWDHDNPAVYPAETTAEAAA